MFTLSELEAMPTLHQGQYDNLKMETFNTRVWLSRLTVADGADYDNEVRIEALVSGRWILAERYPAA